MGGGFSFKCSSRLLALKQRRSHEAALFCSHVYMSHDDNGDDDDEDEDDDDDDDDDDDGGNYHSSHYEKCH